MTAKAAFHLKLTAIAVGVVGLVLTPYALWHEPIDAWFASDAWRDMVASARPYGWAIGVALLIGDLVLPIPTVPVIAAMGVMYGRFVGGLIASAGLVLAGVCAYGLARLAGPRAAKLLADREQLQRMRTFFDSWGIGAVIASRALPVAPEVLSVLAGLAPMRFRRFVLALVAGSLPVGFLTAWAGDAAGASAQLLLILTLIPAGLWCVYLVLVHRLRRADEALGPHRP